VWLCRLKHVRCTLGWGVCLVYLVKFIGVRFAFAFVTMWALVRYRRGCVLNAGGLYNCVVV